jgi:LCP family protein required for cell wall assembly
MSSARHVSADYRSPPRRRRSWPQRIVLTVGCVIVLVCLLGASVAGYALAKWYSVDRVEDLDIAAAPEGEPMNILLVGSDSRAREGADAAAAVTSKLTDTIMVVRVDPRSDQVAVLSFPRDLWIPIADTGEAARINSAFNAPGEEQVLIDTIRQNFGIEINHWVEVDFQGFRQLIDAIGGVTLYIDRALRDVDAGLYMYDLGCVNLDGETALSYARARKVDYLTEDGWEDDPLSDLSRIERQQVLMTEALTKTLGQVRSNPLRMQELADIGLNNVTIDDGLGISDIIDLGKKFKDFSTDRFLTYSLPTVPRPADENTLIVDERQAEEVLNVFRGLDPGEVSPSNIDVNVLNGTVRGDPAQEKQGLARDVSGALQKIGFSVAAPGDADELYQFTTIYHAPGEVSRGQRVARHITGGVVLEENADVQPGHVTVVAGLNFTTVHEQPTPIDQLPPAPGAPPTTAPPATEPAAQDVPPAPPPTQPTTTLPSQVGAVPDGACG